MGSEQPLTLYFCMHSRLALGALLYSVCRKKSIHSFQLFFVAAIRLVVLLKRHNTLV